MSNQVREIIGLAVEQSRGSIPTELQEQVIENLVKIYEQGATPKEAFGISDQIMETCYNHAHNLYKAGKYNKAVRIFEMLRQLNLADARYSFATAVCYHYMGEYTYAAANYVICKEIDPFNPIPCFHLYDCYIKLDKPVAASDVLAEVIVKCGLDPRYSGLKEKALMEKENLLVILKAYIEKNKDEIQEKIKKINQ